MRSTSTKNKLYRDFIGIEDGAYRAVVRFYEAKANEIAQLEFDTYFEILVNYTNALFEIGAYAKHLEQVEQILQLSIFHNIQFYRGEDIYCKSLYQKAASYFNRLQFDKAIYTLKELIKINPNNDLAIRFLKKCLYHTRPAYVQYARAASIFLFLTTAVVAAIEVIFVNPFTLDNNPLFSYLKIGVMSLGIFTLVGSFLLHRLLVNRKVKRFVRRVQS